MRRTILLAALLVLLAGCSELRVIGNAALRELQADAIPVAPAGMISHKVLVGETDETEETAERRTVTAKTGSAYLDWRKEGEKAAKAGKAPARKGLWEGI